MISIAHLGPAGTYAEQAALYYVNWLTKTTNTEAYLRPYSSIFQTLDSVSNCQTDLAVVPVENSIQGGVTITLDTLWQLNNLQIQLAMVMPIIHTLISCSQDLNSIETVYSHPQALAQCQKWLERFLPEVQLIPTNSTTEALQQIENTEATAAISSHRAAQLYNLPVLAKGISDYPENYTRFWVISQRDIQNSGKTAYRDLNHEVLKDTDFYTSLAFSIPANNPGALVKTLQIFAQQNINLSRIESRPTKRSLGEYLFFIDLEANASSAKMQSALAELSNYTEILKIFGSYNVLSTESLF
ncbi:prephenate dehydratase [Rivularia sp. UHCC 0363]|uniref:prephenate dehydratase n=1 Tax=Rivularia sp. UHCC 0363 TaxID=3110244 RepID=UPI002B1EC7DD|nr:prephenate dehydratase [Rivularia sp. UHCC 0363]MEA5593926.1 prephenate dehydratase [Rivularia sp. UHCC 0363]